MEILVNPTLARESMEQTKEFYRQLLDQARTLYGLMTYSVGLRHREIGICMAMGANPAAVVRMVLRRGVVLASSGAAIRLLLSLAAGKLTAALPGGHGVFLPLIAPVRLALLAMAALDAYIPARRASRVDPNTVLRQE